MYLLRRLRNFIVAAGISLIVIGTSFGIPQDFTFWQISDIHSPSLGSASTIAELSKLRPVYLAPYKTMSQPPSFILATGDLTEFGYRGWGAYTSYFSQCRIPVYHQLGNHDNTQGALQQTIRELYGSPYYSFDTFGCHFVGLCSATLQEPLPSFGVETFNWLKMDLALVGQKTPVFVYFHHPLDSNEYASSLERYTLMDILRPYNVVLILVGHGHNAVAYDFDGISGVQGGSTFGAKAGYNVINISKNKLQVAYTLANETVASIKLLEKEIPPTAQYPIITVLNPTTGQVISNGSLTLRATIRNAKEPVKSAFYQIDDGAKMPLPYLDFYYGVTTTVTELMNGAHFVKVSFVLSSATVYRTARFYVENESKPFGFAQGKAKWRYQLGGSSKSVPAVADGNVYIGANDGKLYAFNAKNGARLWTYTTNGEILSSPLVYGNMIYFGSGDGKVYAVTKSGKLQWSYPVGAPVYSSPVIENNIIYIGSNSGKFVALDAGTGTMKWENTEPQYVIEHKPVVLNGVVYFGAWDSFVYALDGQTGKLRWRTQAAGSASRTAAKEYYSAADCPPVVSRNTTLVYFADRDFRISAIDIQSGVISWSTTNCVGVGISRAQEALYLRKYSGDAQLEKVKLDGTTLWTSPVQLNRPPRRFPTAPIEKDGVVYVCSCEGLLYAVDAKDGRILWQYQVTPGLYIMNSVTAADGIVYVSAMDGTITAITK
ncbi:MAG: PQQ-binding-like beta-propeller repeat protein [bacterium]|nr:PQQ-binding-like beta-propeller repeat protein [bacterium]